MHFNWSGVNWTMWVWAFLNWLVPIGLLVLGGIAVVVLLRNRDRNLANRPRGPQDTALAILRERFARGEISEEEFDRRKAKLQADRP